MKPKKIRLLSDAELGKWYRTDFTVFKFVKDETEGYLRGKFKVCVGLDGNFNSCVSVQGKILGSASLIDFKVNRLGDTYDLSRYRITEVDTKSLMRVYVDKVKKAEKEYMKAKEEANRIAKELGMIDYEY